MSEYVGFYVSNEETVFCVKDASGKILARGKVATDPRALFSALREHCLCPGRIVVETGTLSGWLARARALGGLGVAVEVIDARQANAVMRLQHNKTDANDAELLVEIARTGFCRSVAVKSEAAQETLILLKARCHLVRQRHDNMDYSGRISKHGDAMLRALLCGATNSLLTVVRRAQPLKGWARRIKERAPREAEDPSLSGRWPRRSRSLGCKADSRSRLRLIPWEAEAKGHYHEATRRRQGSERA